MFQALSFVVFVVLALLNVTCSGSPTSPSPVSAVPPQASQPPQSLAIAISGYEAFSLDPGMPDNPSTGVGIYIPQGYFSGLLEIPIELQETGSYQLQVSLLRLKENSAPSELVSPLVALDINKKATANLRLPGEPGRYMVRIQRLMSPVKLNGQAIVYYTQEK